VVEERVVRPAKARCLPQARSYRLESKGAGQFLKSSALRTVLVMSQNAEVFVAILHDRGPAHVLEGRRHLVLKAVWKVLQVDRLQARFFDVQRTQLGC